jgi:hypothetical protein
MQPSSLRVVSRVTEPQGKDLGATAPQSLSVVPKYLVGRVLMQLDRVPTQQTFAGNQEYATPGTNKWVAETVALLENIIEEWEPYTGDPCRTQELTSAGVTEDGKGDAAYDPASSWNMTDDLNIANGRLRHEVSRLLAEVERLTRDNERLNAVYEGCHAACSDLRSDVERLTGERDERITEQDYRERTQRWVDEVCHYRNLAIELGAPPERMLNKYDRELAKNKDAHADDETLRDETPELWDELEAAEAEVGRLSGLAWNAIRANYETAGESVMGKISLWNALAELEAALREDGEAG